MIPSTKSSSGTLRRSNIPFLLFFILASIGFAFGTPGRPFTSEQRPLVPEHIEDQTPLTGNANNTTLLDFLDALNVLQDDYFAIWQGIWPDSIDWTSAVIGTYLAAALTTLSTSFPNLESERDAENLINKHFSQLVGSYFGQDAFSLRQQAYDDMLWVVLGWLESIKFISTHSALHYESALGKPWHGTQYIPAFAHRARVFWDLASQGWDTELCNGGMIWSPYLVPYKNAITNELFISASVSMYLYFPGDQNSSPFGLLHPLNQNSPLSSHPHNQKYLAAAIEAYKWLDASNMTDAKGLYVDGFHVSGWSSDIPRNHSRELRCDQRNEMVYTYNQGVLLSGQRGLYQSTTERRYLEDGHRLVSDVIAATGWDLVKDRVLDGPDGGRNLGRWRGLGRSGILEEVCDASGDCSQNSHTFKGIFFHHLISFCSELSDQLVLPGGTFLGKGLKEDKKWHGTNCKQYSKWIKHNMNAAISTRNSDGRFGMWWGAPVGPIDDLDGEVRIPENAVDYRNPGVLPQWEPKKSTQQFHVDKQRDLNDRGRGRTVETQGGGVSVLRAALELVDRI